MEHDILFPNSRVICPGRSPSAMDSVSKDGFESSLLFDVVPEQSCSNDATFDGKLTEES